MGTSGFYGAMAHVGAARLSGEVGCAQVALGRVPLCRRDVCALFENLLLKALPAGFTGVALF